LAPVTNHHDPEATQEESLSRAASDAPVATDYLKQWTIRSNKSRALLPQAFNGPRDGGLAASPNAASSSTA